MAVRVVPDVMTGVDEPPQDTAAVGALDRVAKHEECSVTAVTLELVEDGLGHGTPIVEGERDDGGCDAGPGANRIAGHALVAGSLAEREQRDDLRSTCLPVPHFEPAP